MERPETQLYVKVSDGSKFVQSVMVVTAIIYLGFFAFLFVFRFDSAEPWPYMLRAGLLVLAVAVFFRVTCMTRAPVDAPPKGYVSLL